LFANIAGSLINLQSSMGNCGSSCMEKIPKSYEPSSYRHRCSWQESCRWSSTYTSACQLHVGLPTMGTVCE